MGPAATSYTFLSLCFLAVPAGMIDAAPTQVGTFCTIYATIILILVYFF